MEKEKVSVIIPAYNAAATLPRAVESVLSQTYSPLEIIVVDDGSTDNIGELLTTFGSTIRLVRQENQGRSAARNRGITLATGEYIAFLDADDWWTPDKLAQQVLILQQNPNTALVHSAYFLARPDGAIESTAVSLRGETDDPGAMLFERLVFRNIIGSPSFVLLRTGVLQEMGGFDESLHGTEDWDLWLRIAARYEIGYVARPLAYYQLSKGPSLDRVLARNGHTDWVQIMERLFSYPDVMRQYGYLERRAKAQVWLRSALLDCAVGETINTPTKLTKAVELNKSLFSTPFNELVDWIIEYAKMQINGTTSIEPALSYIDRVWTILPLSLQNEQYLNKRLIKGRLCSTLFLRAKKQCDQRELRKLGWYVVFYKPKWLASRYFWSLWLSSFTSEWQSS